MDGTLVQAPVWGQSLCLAEEGLGRNLTDRGRSGSKIYCHVDQSPIPLGVILVDTHVHDSRLLSDDSFGLRPDCLQKVGDRLKRKSCAGYPLNRIALSILEVQRGKHAEYVFAFRDHPVTRMLNHAWIKARNRAGLPTARVDDLRHTFGRRLRAAGGSFEDCQDLLGHHSRRITTHYCAPELVRLLESANRICQRDQQRPELVILWRASERG